MRQPTRFYDERMASDGQERAALAELAWGDIPPRFCTGVDVEISGDAAHVWPLTNDGPRFERYHVDFRRQDGEWVDAGGSGGFQTGTPEHMRQKANQLESERGPTPRPLR